MSETAARLAFFGVTEPEATPQPTLARARVDAAAAGHAVDVGPARLHRLHGAIRISHDLELRVTTQSRFVAKARLEVVNKPRLVVRLWHRRKRDGTWWTDKRREGITVRAADVEDFARIVAEAARHLAGEAKS